MDWKAMLFKLAASDAAIVFYSALVLFAWNWMKKHQGWDTERWEGLVLDAFNAAEKWAEYNSGGGDSKLRYAIGIFAVKYREAYGKDASATDLRDAALDLARAAYQLKLASVAKADA